MARTANFTFGVAVDGVSVARITVSGAAASGYIDAPIAANDSELEPRHCVTRTVAPDHPLAVALWRSLADETRESVRELEPELAADLDAGSGVPGYSADTVARQRAAADARRKPGTDTHPDADNDA